jgi:hypothetical protein
MTLSGTLPPSSKQASLTVTAGARANAVRNAARFPWAAAERDAAVRSAAPWLVLSDEALWALVPGQELPRSIHVYKVYGTNQTALCPNCKSGIIPSGNYPWLTDVFRRPWKIECPNCHEVYPKNDFGAYYCSALDARGIFRRGKGDARLLFNAEHPDPKDPLHTFAVDDGYGWQEPGGQRWDFIAVYTQWGLWREITRGIGALARAYTLTDEPKYAHKCGVLLARLADVYPEMDWHPLYEAGFSHSDGGSGVGRVEGRIWECGNGRSWALAYDHIFDGIKEDAALARFAGEQHRREGLTPVTSPVLLAAHIERGLIEEIVAGVKDGRLRGNQGMHQSAIIAAALALDRPAETPRLIDWAFAPGTQAADPAHPGRAVVTGGDLANVLVSTMDRDGLGDEGAPGYSLWGSTLQQVADLLEENAKYRAHSLYRDYPKYHQYYHAAWRWACLDAATPPIGDSGATSRWGIVGPGAAALLRAFQVYREAELARFAWRLLGKKLDDVHGSIFDADPEALRRDVAAVVEGPEPLLTSRLMDGFGLAMLQAPQREHGRALWLYFGRNTGHGHLDRLNLGLYAENLDMLPDLGYPEYASGRPRDIAWTRNNASHTVPTVDGAAQQPSYTGHVRAFEPDGKVRLVDVASDSLYPGTTTVRRTAWMVDVDEQHSYVVDIVRLRGGHTHTLSWHGPPGVVTTTGLALVKQERGTFAGPDVPLEALDPEWRNKAGYSFLYDVERDRRPPASFTVDYRAEDNAGRIAAGREPHLRLHSLTPLQEAALADGDPPQNKRGAPRRLKYLMLTRTGEALESVFVTVLEPYDRTPFLRSVRLVPVEPGGEVSAVAVEVTTADGRTDLLIASERPGRATAGGLTLDGAYGFVARRGGRVEIAKLMGGTRLESDGFRLTGATPAYSGTLEAVLAEDPAEQRLRLGTALPEEARRPDRLLLVANDGAQDGAYVVPRWPEPAVASVGENSLIRGYRDRSDPAKGVATNVRAGDRYEVPTFVYVEHPGSGQELRIANTVARLEKGS